jgi:hypothetical protein
MATRALPSRTRPQGARSDEACRALANRGHRARRRNCIPIGAPVGLSSPSRSLTTRTPPPDSAVPDRSGAEQSESAEHGRVRVPTRPRDRPTRSHRSSIWSRTDRAVVLGAAVTPSVYLPSFAVACNHHGGELSRSGGSTAARDWRRHRQYGPARGSNSRRPAERSAASRRCLLVPKLTVRELFLMPAIAQSSWTKRQRRS